MRYKIAFLLILSFSQLQSARRLDVYLAFSECISCYANLNALDLVEGYEKNIFIQKIDSLAAREFLENYPLQKTVAYHYISTKPSDLSYCKVYINNAFTDSFSLSVLSQKIKLLNLRALQPPDDPKLRSFYLPKGTILKSNRLALSVRGNYINIYDYILNKNLLLSIPPLSDTLTKVLEIKGSQFPQNAFLRLAGFDSLLYFNCFNDLKQHGKSTAHIENAFLGDSSLFLLLSFTRPYIDAKRAHDTIIDMSFFTYERNFISGAKKLVYLDVSELLKKYNSNYDIHIARPFFVDPAAKKAVFSVLSYALPEQVALLAEFKEKGSYTFNRLVPLMESKSEHLKNRTDSFALLGNARFYFGIKLKFVIDRQSSKRIDLKAIELPPDAFAVDIIQQNSVMELLILQKGEIEIISYDVEKQKIIARTKKEKLPADCSAITLRFYNKSTLAFLDKTSSKLYLMYISAQ